VNFGGVVFDVDVDVVEVENCGVLLEGGWVELIGVPNAGLEFVLDEDVCLFEVESSEKGLKDGTSDLF